jgi:hypothetical protein
LKFGQKNWSRTIRPNFFFLKSTSDRGHSFDALLLYGHEFSLTIFDLMVFSFVDLFTEDFLAAAITTFFVAKVFFNLKWDHYCDNR